jgi:hypothetical protein
MVSQGAADCANLLPISSFQKRMLFAAENPDTVPGYHELMTICWAFRVSPAVSPRTFNRSFNRLVTRHDSLRLQFKKSNDGWRAEILPRHPQGIQVVDLSQHSAAEQNTIISEYASQSKSALSQPLFDMHLFRCGASEDVVLGRAHHSIFDGYSVALINEDLMKSVLNLPSVGTPPGHKEFIEFYLEKAQADLAEKNAYWEAAILPPPADPMIGRKVKNLAPVSYTTLNQTTRIDAILTEKESQIVAARAKTYGVTAFALLHAAFSEMMCEVAGQKEVLVWSVLGRHDARMSQFVGTIIEPIPLRYRANPGQLGERAAWVTKEIAAASRHVPTDAFLPSKPVADGFEKMGIPLKRFRVHIANPLGQVAETPFKKLFDKGSQAKLSFGFLSVEPVPLPTRFETSYELDFVIEQTKNGPNAALLGDAEAYTRSDLTDLLKGIRHQLGFA